MAEALLELRGVHTHIGHYHILQGVDLVVPRGELTMLLGRNGAGKTTTLRTIIALWRASAGSIRFEGNDIAAAQTPAIADLGIAYVPESMGIFAGLTVRENLLLAARRRPPDEAHLESIFRFFPPTTNPSRTIPQWSDIVNNNTTLGEILPNATRSLGAAGGCKLKV